MYIHYGTNKWMFCRQQNNTIICIINFPKPIGIQQTPSNISKDLVLINTLLWSADKSDLMMLLDIKMKMCIFSSRLAFGIYSIQIEKPLIVNFKLFRL